MIALHLFKKTTGACFQAAFLALAMLLLAGCQTPDSGPVQGDHDSPKLSLQIAPGDSLLINFPNASTLDNTYKVGADGKLTLPYVGQVDAIGKTTQQLQEELVKLYSTQLQNTDVLVSLASSANIVYVTGAVLKPGRVPLDRPLTVLEAIMEAGGFNPQTANLKKVGVLRFENGKNVRYNLNLEPTIEGQGSTRFYLQPRDIITVPEKVQWF